MDKVFQQLFVKYRNSNGHRGEFKIGIKLFSQYTLAKTLSHIVTINPKAKLDDYCQNLLDKYDNNPEKLERNWQEKFEVKSPFSQKVSDVFMFIILLLCIYLFLHISTLNGWCWGRDNCFPGPII